MPFVHPEFEVTTPPGLAAEPDTYRGPGGVRRYFESFYEAMDRVGFEPERFIAVGDAGGRPDDASRTRAHAPGSRPRRRSSRCGSSRTARRSG